MLLFSERCGLIFYGNSSYIGLRLIGLIFFFLIASQLAEIVLEHGPDVLGIPMEMKKEILLNLHEASLAMDPPEDWEGAMPDQIVMQLASSWGIDVQQHDK